MGATHIRDTPEQWALLCALIWRLCGRKMCQSSAETWLELMRPLWDYEKNGPSVHEFPQIVKWAKLLSEQNDPKNRADSDEDCYGALGGYLSAILSHAWRPEHLSSSLAEGLLNSVSHWRFLQRRSARLGIQELLDVSRTCELSGCPFFVNPNSEEGRHRIMLESRAEILSVDGFRIRPQLLQADGISRLNGDGSVFHIGQFVEMSHAGESSRTTEWDTIMEDNPDFPFWPTSNHSPSHTFSYRCAVHKIGNQLAWSDWPQILVDQQDEIPPIWHFVTGLFQSEIHGGITHHNLAGRFEWSINWDERP